MDKQDVRDIINAYWGELESNTGWIDLGMSIPSVNLFPPDIIATKDFLQGMGHRTDYQHPAGPRELREEIANYETLRTRVKYNSDNVMLVGGAFRGFSHTINCLLSETSQLVGIVPTYPTLAGYVQFVAEKHKVRCSTIYPSDSITFQIMYEEVLPFIQQSTILWFTNPNNPLGLYMPSEIFTTIVRRCEEVNAHIVVDESCDIPLYYGDEDHGWIESPALIRIQSFAKRYLLGGYRIGCIIANANLIQMFSNVYGLSDGNASLMANEALIKYLSNKELLSSISTVVRDRVEKALKELANCSRISHIVIPRACFYIFMKIDYAEGSWKLFTHLLKAGLNVTPGNLFGINEQEAWIRINCAYNDEYLLEGLDRLRHALTSVL